MQSDVLTQPAASSELAANPRETFIASRRPWYRSSAAILFASAFIAYVGVGAVLVYGFHSQMIDATARVANASYVLYSRDPHLSSIGFVWPPLPTLVLVPLLPLKAIIPGLVSQAFASNIVSAAFMAGAVVQVRGALLERGVSRRSALALTAAFALHPMIIYYGANGMTEAMAIFFLVLAARALMRWVATDEPRALVTGGIALACAYLTRYESIAAGVGAITLVFLISYRRGGSGSSRQRAMTDAVILGTPMLFALVAWAVAGWLIVGEPFGYMTSVYGNTSNVTLAGGSIVGLGPRHILRLLLVLQPLLIPIIVAAMLTVLRRRTAAPFGALAVIGSALCFSVLLYLRGTTVGYLRYFIHAIPLAVLLAGELMPRQDEAARPRRRLLRGAWALSVLLLVGAAAPAAIAGMSSPKLAPQESVLSHLRTPGLTLAKRRALLDQFTGERDVAAFLDGLRLPNGSVLLDSGTGSDIILQSRNPRQFVITNDRDFQAALQAPLLFKIQYLVTIPNVGLGRIDAINRAYPSVFESGAVLGRMIKEVQGKYWRWRIYRLEV